MARMRSWRGMPSFDPVGDGRPVRPEWRPTEPVTPPRSAVEAVRAMQVGAALSVLDVVRAFLFSGHLRPAFAAEAQRQGSTVTSGDLDALVTLALTVTTAVGLVAATAWFVLSRLTARGSKWGRIVACVLLALGALSFFGGLVPTAGPLARTLPLVGLMVGVYAVARLWHRDTSAWIRYQSRPIP